MLQPRYPTNVFWFYTKLKEDYTMGLTYTGVGTLQITRIWQNYFGNYNNQRGIKHDKNHSNRRRRA